MQAPRHGPRLEALAVGAGRASLEAPGAEAAARSEAVMYTSPDLVAACQTGNRAAFRRLFEAYRLRVYSTARHILGNDAGAKDVTQQVFLAVWRHLARFQSESELGPWLYRVTVNTCLNERRRLGRFVDADPADPVVGARQEDAVLARQMQGALARLSPKLRVPLVLRHLEGLSYDEMAEVLGCTMGTVASRLSRAHRALAKVLSRDHRKAR